MAKYKGEGTIKKTYTDEELSTPLQKLSGHSTLDMTTHYRAIFDADIAKNFDSFFPLEQMKSNSTKRKRNA